MKIPGIYKIQSSKKPWRCYIGSAVNIQRRWFEHLRALRNNSHHSSKLQHHYNKYGEHDLQFSIIVGCEKQDLIKNEQFFLDIYTPYFNICKSARGCLGRVLSEETKKKISKSHIGIKNNPEALEKIRRANLGRKNPHTPEQNLKISLAQKGRKLTEEHKAKLRKAKIGHIPWNKGKRGIQEAWNKGKKKINGIYINAN